MNGVFVLRGERRGRLPFDPPRDRRGTSGRRASSAVANRRMLRRLVGCGSRRSSPRSTSWLTAAPMDCAVMPERRAISAVDTPGVHRTCCRALCCAKVRSSARSARSSRPAMIWENCQARYPVVGKAASVTAAVYESEVRSLRACHRSMELGLRRVARRLTGQPTAARRGPRASSQRSTTAPTRIHATRTTTPAVRPSLLKWDRPWTARTPTPTGRISESGCSQPGR